MTAIQPALLTEQKCFNGQVMKYRHWSDACQCTMQFNLFMPNSVESVPLLIFLSGLTCNEDNFMTKSSVQRDASLHGIAVLAPDTSPRGVECPGDRERWDFGQGAGFYCDATVDAYSKHYRMYSYILELMHVMKQFFPLIDTSRVSLSGHSMGGHGALILALREPPGTWKSISAFAPIAHPTQCPWGERAFSGYLGPNRQLWQDYDATCLAKKYKSPHILPILIDQGTSDQFYRELQLQPEAFAAAVESNPHQIELTMRLHQGYDHSYYFISTFIADHVAFHAKYLKK